jgi:N-methylhydantoinase A
VLVPERPGALCALGLLMTDLRTDYSRTRVVPAVEEAVATFAGMFGELADEAEAWFTAEGISPERRCGGRSLAMRYVGQNYELTVPVPDGQVDAAAVARLVDAFHAEHERTYGYTARDLDVEAVTFRFEVIGRVPRAELTSKRPAHRPRRRHRSARARRSSPNLAASSIVECSIVTGYGPAPC